MPITMPIRRGDVLRARLDPVEGAEQSGERPVLVISPDVINIHSPVVLIAPITSRKTERVYPFEAFIDPPDGGLTVRSKAMLLQMRSLDKKRLMSRYGRISEETMLQVDEALLVATGLTRF